MSLTSSSSSEEERDRLLWFGGTIEHINHLFLSALDAHLHPTELSDMLVTDVATIAPNDFAGGGFLSLGTGFFDHIYVIVPADDQLFLARGSVYSHYEFESESRLTDEEWWAMNGLIMREIELFGAYLEYGEPSEDMPAQPFWVDRFKSHSNDVMIQELEIDWSWLNE